LNKKRERKLREKLKIELIKRLKKRQNKRVCKSLNLLKFKMIRNNKNFSSRRDLNLFLLLEIRQSIRSEKMSLKKH
jgi:hypothetical protein